LEQYLTSAMMLEYLGYQTVSRMIEEAVRAAISAEETTRDLGGKLSQSRLVPRSVNRLGSTE